jgi:hypothetical protein
MSTATNLRGICCRVLGLVFFPIAVWRRTARGTAGSRPPTERWQNKSRTLRPGRTWETRGNISTLAQCAFLTRNVRFLRNQAKSTLIRPLRAEDTSKRLAFAQQFKGHSTMPLCALLPDRPSPVKARAVRDRLRRLAALTGLRRSDSWAAMRSWLPVSEIAPVATEAEVAA